MAVAYDWVLDARPRTDSISRVKCLWRFRSGHFELLEINITAVADPQHLAETLALGVDAAGLRGWSEGDAQNVYAWLLNLLNERPLDNWVRAKNRMGHVLVEALRLPDSRTEFKVQLTVTETETALDGSLLDESGRPSSQGDRGAPPRDLDGSGGAQE